MNSLIKAIETNKKKIQTACQQSGMDQKSASQMTEQLVLATKMTGFRNKSILKCTVSSVLNALVEAATMGLVPNSQGDCYLVPYKDKCELVVGYRGLIKIGYRSKRMLNCSTRIVREGDSLEVVFGTEERIDHKPLVGAEQRPAVAVFCKVELSTGVVHHELMEMWEVEKLRDSLVSARGASSPWNLHFGEMARKTVAHRAMKWLAIDTMDLPDIDSQFEAELESNVIDIQEKPKPLEGVEVERVLSQISDSTEKAKAKTQKIIEPSENSVEKTTGSPQK